MVAPYPNNISFNFLIWKVICFHRTCSFRALLSIFFFGLQINGRPFCVWLCTLYHPSYGNCNICFSIIFIGSLLSLTFALNTSLWSVDMNAFAEKLAHAGRRSSFLKLSLNIIAAFHAVVDLEKAVQRLSNNNFLILHGSSVCVWQELPATNS